MVDGAMLDYSTSVNGDDSGLNSDYDVDCAGGSDGQGLESVCDDDVGSVLMFYGAGGGVQD